VLLLPLAMSLPWIYRKLGSLLDSLWLGRRFTPVEAVKHFLSGLQNATSEAELVERAESGLSEIFQARTGFDLTPSVPKDLDFEVVQEVPIGSESGSVGAIRMGRRQSQVPYFGEDVALLRSLADVFFYMLQNIRLQKKKREQEKVAKELSLHASRSELKALRAQINPHFLFNALNAIASLIHKDPVRADQTVEQLAEVFRYTLRGSESEWALLEDEIEFVSSYLEVERSRFGQRLRVRVSVGEGVRAAKIPTMMVQTLVENAVKHGVAQVRGPARIEIDAHMRDDRLVIEVADSGPGPAEAGSRPSRSRARRGSGYGLKNIRQRLAGHYGDRAELGLRREEERAMTVARITLPLARDEKHGVA
jgi:sensor histidine kinase YesM